MVLHFAGNPGIVSPGPVNKIGRPLHHSGHAFAPAFVKNAGVCNPDDLSSPELFILLLNPVNLGGNLGRMHSQTHVGCTGAAVIFPDVVQSPVRVSGKPAHGKGPGITEVKASINAPVGGNGKRVNDMGPAVILIVGGIVAPFGKHLPVKGIPAAIQQCTSFRRGQKGKTGQVSGVIFQQFPVVKYGRGNKNPGTAHGFPSLRRVHLYLLHNRRHGRRGGNKPLFHPTVSNSSRIGSRPDIDPGTGAAGTVAAEQIAVFLPGKVGQLVKSDKVIPFALIINFVRGMLHGTKVNFCPAGKFPIVAGRVVAGGGKRTVIQRAAPVDEFRQLRIGFPQNQPPIMGNVHLPQGFRQQGITFAAACRAAIQGFIFRS